MIKVNKNNITFLLQLQKDYKNYNLVTQNGKTVIYYGRIENNKQGGSTVKFHLHTYQKRFFAAMLCGTMMLPLATSAFAANTDTITSTFFAQAQAGAADLKDSGYALQRLGLVSGDENGDLMLNKIGTRQEAFTMFISLLGERDEANEVNYSYTFRDVASWFSNFAGYGINRGYTAGYSDEEFGAQDSVTLNQYMTFILRALGYTTEDFSWDHAVDKAIEIGLCTEKQANTWKNETFRRQEIMEVSYLALSTRMKDSKSTLADKLIASGDITAEGAKAEGLTYGHAYNESNRESSKKIIPHDTIKSGEFEIHNVGTKTVMTVSGASDQSDVVAAADKNTKNQQFKIVTASNGTFQIAAVTNNGLVMDSNPTDDADTILWKTNGSECQQYVASQVSAGVYALRLATSGAALTVVNGDVRLAPYTGAANQQWQFKDLPKIQVDDTAAASAKLNNIMKNVHPDGKNLGSGYSFGGAKQCMAFGREIFNRMYGQTAKWNYDGSPKSSADGKLFKVTARSSSYSAGSMKSLISKAKPGDILQMDGPKIHTMVFVSSDANGFTVYDANWSGPNQVDVRYVKYGGWSSRNSDGITVLHATNYPKTYQ